MEWGPGTKHSNVFDKSKFDDGTEFDLFFGEHPHSRQDNNMYARFADGTIQEFDGHRILTNVEFRTFNYLKCSSLSGNEIRKGGQLKIYLNEKLVWAEFCREDVRGMRLAATRLEEIYDCSGRLWELDTIVGRRIYYRNHPAIIKEFMCDQNEGNGNRLIIVPDGPPFPKPCYLESYEEYEGDVVITNSLDKDIWWFRNQ